MTNIEIPPEIKAKLAPMIIKSITAKLKESGVTVNEEAIRQLVNDENNKIEFPAIVVGPRGPGGRIVVCTLLPQSEARLMGGENEVTASTVLTLRGEAAKNIIR